MTETNLAHWDTRDVERAYAVSHAPCLADCGAPERLCELLGSGDADVVTLPGGESSTHLKVMTEEGLFDALKGFAAKGGAFFGTCAGAILLAREVHGPAQASLGLLDVTDFAEWLRQTACERRSYGADEAAQGTAGDGFHPRADY